MRLIKELSNRKIIIHPKCGKRIYKMGLFECPICKKKIEKTLQKGRRDKTCSLKCRRCKGKYNPNWKGGRIIKKGGYIQIYVPVHPRAVGCYVYEHIIVAEKKIGRLLKLTECCHHINGIVYDNRPENIAVMTIKKHNRLHGKLHRKKKEVDDE